MLLVVRDWVACHIWWMLCSSAAGHPVVQLIEIEKASRNAWVENCEWGGLHKGGGGGSVIVGCLDSPSKESVIGREILLELDTLLVAMLGWRTILLPSWPKLLQNTSQKQLFCDIFVIFF